MAALTEYQAIVPSVFLALFVMQQSLSSRRYSSAVLFGLGALPFAIAFLTYNKLTFGGMWELSYHHLANAGTRQIHEQGVGGIGLPKVRYFAGALLVCTAVSLLLRHGHFLRL